jgi:hypothetical protein
MNCEGGNDEGASFDVVVAGPHMLFPSLGRVRKDKEGNGYFWSPVAFTEQWGCEGSNQSLRDGCHEEV